MQLTAGQSVYKVTAAHGVAAVVGPDATRIAINKTYYQYDGLTNTGEEVSRKANGDGMTASLIVFIAPADFVIPIDDSFSPVVTLSGTSFTL